MAVPNKPPRRQGRQDQNEKKSKIASYPITPLPFLIIDFSFFSWRPWRLGGLF
jgi:hypothetical protein